MSNKIEPTVVILNFASRYVSSSNSLSDIDQYLYSELYLASQMLNNPTVVGNPTKRLNNLLIICADKLNDIPVWFYFNNPYVKTLTIQKPPKFIREMYYESYFPEFQGNEFIGTMSAPEQEKLKRKFVDLTEGLRLVDLDTLRGMMAQEEIPLTKIDQAISLFKYGIKENPWNESDLMTRLNDLEKDLRTYVKGQDNCIKHATDIIIRAVYGLSGIQHSSSYSKPKGVMFFAGPTGVGKTELAKSLARWLFGTEEACIRFDMSEYSQSHSDQKLLGAPPGYIGYEAGGQLTNAIKEHPFSILLFDEIEKADKSILDKFLQILEDGRMTDGKGETVYFSDAIIIFTSNLGVSKVNPLTNERIPIISYDEEYQDYDTYRSLVMSGVEDYFINQIGRPEVMNRIGDNFVIFEYIRKDIAEQIADSILSKIKANLKSQKDISLVILPEAQETIMSKIYEHLSLGGRGVGNAIEKYLVNPLSRYMAEYKVKDSSKITIQQFEIKDNQCRLVCS